MLLKINLKIFLNIIITFNFLTFHSTTFLWLRKFKSPIIILLNKLFSSLHNQYLTIIAKNGFFAFLPAFRFLTISAEEEGA